MSESMSKGLLVGFLSGAIVGGVVALLYAPKSGKELRQDIKTKSGEFADDVEDYLKDAQGKAKEIIAEGKEKSTSLMSEAKQKAEALMHDAEELLSDAKRKIAGEGTKLKTAVRAGVDAFKEEQQTPDTF
jgi:gas vesicle protein